MMRHIVAGTFLCIISAFLGAMLLGGVSACGGGCPGHCAGIVLAARVEPPIDCVEVFPDKIDGDCGCDVYVRLHNTCDTEVLVAVGDVSRSRCFDDPKSYCSSISPGETSEVRRWASDGREARFPLWKDGVRHEIVADVQIDWD